MPSPTRCALLLVLFASGVRARCGHLCQIERRKVSPPPPPPLDTWNAKSVGAFVGSLGINATQFVSNDMDGAALQEWWESRTEAPKERSKGEEFHERG